MTGGPRGPSRGASPAFLLTLLFAVLYAVFHVFQKKLIDSDTCYWIEYGLQIFRGDLGSFHFSGDAPPFSPLVYAPGFPFLVGLAHLVFKNPVFCAHLVSLAASVLALRVIHDLARELFGPAVGLIALLFAGVYTQLVNTGASEHMVSSAILFLVLAVHTFILSLRREGAVYPLLAGAVGGLAVLMRFEFAFYMILFAAVYAWKAARRTLPLRSPAVFGAALAVVYALYAVPLYRHSGFLLIPPSLGSKMGPARHPDKPDFNAANYLRLNESGRTLLFNRNTASTATLAVQNRVRVSDEDWARFEEERRRNPAAGRGRLANYGIYFERHFPKLFRFYLIPLLLLGTGHCLARRVRQSGILFLVVASTLAVFPLGNVETDRYYLPLVPFLLIIASAGIQSAAAALRRVKDAPWILPAMMGVLIAGFTANNLRSLVPAYTRQEQVLMKAGEYLRTQAPRGSIVMAQKRLPAYLGGLRTSALPDERNLEDVWEYARHIGAGYLVIDRGLTAALMPQYEGLLGGPLPEALEVAHEIFPGTEDEARILRFRWERP